jgi:hypothetical protein
MADYDAFQHGGVVYPLTASTTNTLLKDADPALHKALDYLAAMLHYHVGARLQAQAALEGLAITNAVRQQLHVEPAPFLYADQLTFPTLAIYRKSEEYEEKTISYEHDTSEWEFAYLLPPLTPLQITKLQPILRSAAQAIRHAVHQGWHPSYNSGEKVWSTAGIQTIRVTGVKYGGYEPLQEIPTYYRAIVGTMSVIERTMPYEQGFDVFNGADVVVDAEDVDGTAVLAVVDDKTLPAPTLASISPASGTKDGGTLVTITGAGFKVGTTPLVSIGGALCSNVVVTSTTQITAVTSAHAAYPTYLADVIVTNVDGQQATLADAFSYGGVDPETLPLEGWWEDYVGGTWVGKASEGSSGSHDLTVVSAPSVGAPLGGHGTASFAAGQSLTGGLLSQFHTLGAWSAWALVNPTSGAFLAFSSAAFNWTVAVIQNFGLQASCTQQTGGPSALPVAVYGTYCLVQADYDGTTVRVRINGNAWATSTRPNLASLAVAMNVGVTSGGGVAASLGVAATKFSDATHNGILERMRSWSGLSLS